jgi:hypothetical protein
MTKKIDRQANDGIEQACVLPGYRQQNAATKKPPLIALTSSGLGKRGTGLRTLRHQ